MSCRSTLLTNDKWKNLKLLTHISISHSNRETAELNGPIAYLAPQPSTRSLRPLPCFLFPLTDPENLQLFLITFCFSVLFTCYFLKFCLPKCCFCAQLLQLCPTLCGPMDYSPPGSSVHGILQARVLEWIAMPSSRGIFLTWGSNPSHLCLLYADSLPRSHWGSPEMLTFPKAIFFVIVSPIF